MNNITIKNIVKAAKAAKADRLLLHREFISDGRIAIALSALAAADREMLILPDAATLPADNAGRKEYDEFQVRNTAASDRLKILTGFKDCSVLADNGAAIWQAPKKIRGFRYTGLVYAPNIGLGAGAKGKTELCIFEELGDIAPTAPSKVEQEIEISAAREPEKPGYGLSASGLDPEECAPGAPRRIGINRHYFELLELGASVVYMDYEKELGPCFTEMPIGSGTGADAISGCLVMPARGA